MTDLHVHTLDDIAAADGRTVVAHGEYRALPRPVGGIVRRTRPADRAALVLTDGTMVWLEPYDAAAAERPADERERLDGVAVSARGTAHRFMPSKGQSPLAPCLSDVHGVEEER